MCGQFDLSGQQIPTVAARLDASSPKITPGWHVFLASMMLGQSQDQAWGNDVAKEAPALLRNVTSDRAKFAHHGPMQPPDGKTQTLHT